MKNVLRLIALNAVVAAACLSALAQQPTGGAAAATPAAQDDKAKCIDLYNTWRENRAGDAAAQKKAYDAGKEYLTKCPSDEYVSYVQKWIPKYEKAVLEVEFETSIRNNNTTEAFRLGRQLLASDPDNVLLNYRLAVFGLNNKNEGDTLAFARRALALIESGKADALTPEQWKTAGITKGKSEALGWLNYAVASTSVKNSPKDAIPALIKVAQGDSPLKSDPATYYQLAQAYQVAEYKPMADDYKANCEGKDLTDECKAKLDAMNLVVDRIIDAYARAISLANANPKYTSDANLKTAKERWMATLTELYKFRNQDKTDGLDALISGIQSKPLLLKENQTMPTPAPTTGTTTPSGGASGTGTGNGATTPTSPSPTATPTPATAKPSPATNTTKPASTGAPQPAPKPAASAKPVADKGAKGGVKARVRSSRRP